MFLFMKVSKMLPSVVKVIQFCLYASLCLYFSEAKKHSILAVLGFGDSFLDTGNNNYIKSLCKADFPPYGKDFMGGKSTGRFCNGRTIGDYMVEKLGVKDYLQAYLDPSIQDKDFVTGVSFASGCSGYDPMTSIPLNVTSIMSQLDMFKEYIGKLKRIVGEEEANNIINKSIYLVSASSNDWAISYAVVPFRRLQYDASGYAKLLADKAASFTKGLYKLGARKMVILGTPYIGCWPLARTVVGGIHRICGDKFNEEAQAFNRMLKTHIKVLESSLPKSKICYIDYYKISQDIIENPQKYGFQVVDKGCCGTGTMEVSILCNHDNPICSDANKYLFWDSLHLTEKGYSMVVNQALPELIACLF